MKKEHDIPRVEDLERILMAEGSQFERWEWRIKGTRIRHHPHEPAAQHKNGDWVWYWMGNEHRLDGPSSLWEGKNQYWIHGNQLTREEWERDLRRLEWLRSQMEGI